MLGLPLGLMAAFFSTGPLVAAFGDWRAPFVIAALPGFGVGDPDVLHPRAGPRRQREGPGRGRARAERPIRTISCAPGPSSG